jgi:hypothetical protein
MINRSDKKKFNIADMPIILVCWGIGSLAGGIFGYDLLAWKKCGGVIEALTFNCSNVGMSGGIFTVLGVATGYILLFFAFVIFVANQFENGNKSNGTKNI